MNSPIPLSSILQGIPPAPVLRILAQHSREELAGFIAVAIDLLDLAEGEPDAEDATDAEDDFKLSPDAIAAASDGPGCDVSDPGGQCDEDEINTAFVARHLHSGPGCEISDPDCEHDGRELEGGRI